MEDDFASCLATEIVRLCDPHLLAGTNFLKIGGGEQIPAAVKILRRAKARTVGICDGDMPESIYSMEGMCRLPGSLPPEKEVFYDDAVVAHFKRSPYGIDLPHILAVAEDHHQFAEVVAAEVMTDRSVIIAEACRAYVAARTAGDFGALTDFLRRELGDRN
ncbi:hypothetical protein ACFQZ8_00555 [Micromonospora azadirachtae]|uniref:Uncharacterized protein n=1 Tax=Micromonospora azadirachtae TaxID=1970735 RepID=A0ABW2ZV75_9ACTN